MDNLWAPWRMAYINTLDSEQIPLPSDENFYPGADKNCFICQALADEAHRKERHVVYVGERVLVVMNKYPYNNGHLLVTPKRHVGNIAELTPEEHLELMATVTKMIEKFKAVMNPDGFNVGLNLGRVAGAGLPGHLHWHIVPRWNGDTNFMPVFADVKVIPQSLEALWELLVNES